MAPNIEEQYHTYEGRFASFLNGQPLSKRRTSSVSTKTPKSIKWPHSFLEPEAMAKAGFFHYPTQENPDNTVCFMCRRSMDGWEKDDNPLAEHLKHSPDCGWAIVASIDAREEVLSNEYPLSARMIEARKATFGDRWPHEDKKGWKCKVKQLVDAGWKYTPTPEYDDMATCAYCELALDGWEPSDKPLDEHHKRSPDCAFFTLVNEHQQSSKLILPTKAKKSRASKVSRISTQSSFTIASDAPTVDDLPAEEEDSILTTATNATMTSQAGRKTIKGKKPAKIRKTKAKKDEPIEASSLIEPEDDDFEVKVQSPKATRGKKRPSEAMDEASAVKSTLPPAKRRGTRATRGSVAPGGEAPAPLIVEADGDTVMATTGDIALKKAAPNGKRGLPSNSKAQRNVSTASKASLRLDVADNDKIDKALDADLEKPFTDEEDDDAITIQAPKTLRESRVKKLTTAASVAPIRKPTRSSRTTKEDYDMLSTETLIVDESAIEKELEAMEVEESKPLLKAKAARGKQPRKPSAKQQAAAKQVAEAAQAQMEVEEAVTDSSVFDSTALPYPKARRGRMASTMSNSQNAPARSTRASSVSRNGGNMSAIARLDDMRDSGNDSDASIEIQSTVVKGGAKRRGSSLKKTKGGKKAASQNIEEIVNKSFSTAPIEQLIDDQPPKKTAGRPKKSVQSEEPVVTDTVSHISIAPQAPAKKPIVKTIKRKPVKGKDKDKALPDLPAEGELNPLNTTVESPLESSKRVLPENPTKTQLPESPKRVPKELTPSLSPQSSDAENQPPSSKPSIVKPIFQQSQTSRIPLIATTPIDSSSKHNVIACLQSSHPWTAVDLDEILIKSPSSTQADRENPMTSLLAEAVGKVKKGDLSSPEKKMTVEEWILHNAGLAEEQLRSDCETMVGVFEREGGRAMRVLEGVECVG